MVSKAHNTLRLRNILTFWLPIAATWLMMAVEGPFIAAIIARLPDLEYNLAAYGIAFSIGLLVEAPIMMLISASVALVRDDGSYRALCRFTLRLNGIITLAMAVTTIPCVFRAIAIHLMHLPDDLAELAHGATILLMPWPAAIGFRRFYQGLLIRGHRTRRVAVGTVIRLVGMGSTALVLAHWTALPGAWVGCAALSTGVVVEAASIWIMTWDVIQRIRQVPAVSQPLTHSAIWRFYYPLAMSSLMALGIRPVISFFVALCPHPIESLAVLPVVHSASFLFICFGLSFQEVALALMGDRFQHLHSVTRFAQIMAGILSFAAVIVAFSPLSEFWFAVVSDLPSDLTAFAIVPFRLTGILPALAVAHSLQRAVLVNAGKNSSITWATAVEVTAIALAMIAMVSLWSVNGVIAAIVSLLIGRVVSNITLFWWYRLEVIKIQPISG
ncbi:hypothetical protein JXA80_07930 [bacterium]|nr:hypothetical protein [candidate division CSSED10-310 bacterium]